MLDWGEGMFYLHTNYVQYDLAKEALTDKKIQFKEKSIDLDELVYGQRPNEV